MPPRRQLPWVTKGGASKTQVKRSPVKRPIPPDIDDDFFDGTVLESSRKRKERANAQDPDDDFPEPPFKFSRTTHDGRESSPSARMPSSSPPPIAADLPPPKTEYMLTGIDKFDLRDDEWMMVEDELLQVAKLFTQHLHLAEYETLKTKMEELKKTTTERPVVANAKPSVEGHFKRKAQEQARTQRKAIREVLSTRDSSSEDDEEPTRVALKESASSFPPARPSTTTRPLSTFGPLQTSESVSHKSAFDSDDLDKPKRLTIEKPPSIVARSPADKGPAKEPTVFAKPAIPSNARTRPTRGQRRNLWDDWDELTASPKTSIPMPSPSSTPRRASSPTKAVGLSTDRHSSPSTRSLHTATPKRTINYLSASSKRSTTTSGHEELNNFKWNPLAKETADRLGKRKADKEREDRKKTKYDDIPTFLF